MKQKREHKGFRIGAAYPSWKTEYDFVPMNLEHPPKVEKKARKLSAF